MGYAIMFTQYVLLPMFLKGAIYGPRFLVKSMEHENAILERSVVTCLLYKISFAWKNLEIREEKLGNNKKTM